VISKSDTIAWLDIDNHWFATTDEDLFSKMISVWGFNDHKEIA